MDEGEKKSEIKRFELRLFVWVRLCRRRLCVRLSVTVYSKIEWKQIVSRENFKIDLRHCSSRGYSGPGFIRPATANQTRQKPVVQAVALSASHRQEGISDGYLYSFLVPWCDWKRNERRNPGRWRWQQREKWCPNWPLFPSLSQAKRSRERTARWTRYP